MPYLVVTVSPEGVVATAVETKEEARILASKKTIKVSMQEAISDSSAELGAHSKSNSFLTRASAVTNSRMQASETRLGRGACEPVRLLPEAPDEHEGHALEFGARLQFPQHAHNFGFKV